MALSVLRVSPARMIVQLTDDFVSRLAESKIRIFVIALGEVVAFPLMDLEDNMHEVAFTSIEFRIANRGFVIAEPARQLRKVILEAGFG